jgi:ATP-dependent Clp protease ATP-binding subunit ClpC
LFEQLTERAKHTMMLAQEEARKLGHDYVGTGMMLLGVVEEGGTASKILDGFGVTLEATREEVLALIGRSSRPVRVEIPFSENAQRVFEIAREEAESRSIKDVAVPHLLLGLLSVQDTMAIRVFDVMGVNFNDVKQRVMEELDKSYGSRT